MKNKQNRGFITRILEYQNIGVTVSLIVILIVSAFFAPSMLSFESMMRLLKNNMLYGLVAIGVMFVLITGGIDLSTGAILSLTCNLTGIIQQQTKGKNEWPLIALILISLAVGLACGLFNGFLVGKLRIHPMLATLGSQYIFLSLSFEVNNMNVMANMLYKSVKRFASTRTLGIFNCVWILIGMYLLVGFILSYTRSGRKIYAIGSNRESAVIAGMNPVSVQMIAYALCGMCCGLAGFMFVSNYSLAQFNVSGDFAMKAICIAVLGGVSPKGGRGRIDGMFISILVISCISYFTSLIPSLGLWNDAFYGALVIGALFINALTERIQKKRDLTRKEAGLNVNR